MSFDKPIRRIAIVGTGVIGASWAAQYLARGFDVVATDPAPNAEENLRKYVDNAWELAHGNRAYARRIARPPELYRRRCRTPLRMPTSFRRTVPRDRNSRPSSSPIWMMPLLLIRSSRRVHRE